MDVESRQLIEILIYSFFGVLWGVSLVIAFILLFVFRYED